jgi:hypothetical protein
MELSIIPECYIDTNLIETLVPPQRGYNHQKGCGTVVKVMKGHFADSFAVGIIDKDKQELDYLNEFEIVFIKASIELYRHKQRNHFIIRIVPAMERFIIHNVKQAGFSLDDFGLPSDFDLFRKVSKTVNSKKDEKFRHLFNSLRKRDLVDFNILSKCLNYLISHPFDADLDALKAL